MYKVVIIDDEAIIRNSMKGLVKWEKFDCEVVGTADDGFEGKKLIEKLRPHIIFTDIRMPNCDGLRMLNDLKSIIADTETTIMTAFGELEYARTAIKIGVKRYLMKPSQMDEIEEALFCMVANLDKKIGKLRFHSENHFVDIVLKEISNHYNEKITLVEIAEKNEITVWHLSKLIGKHCNKTFKDLLNETRVKYAQKFLLETNCKIYEIADNVGITDITYFSKVFKKYSDGLTPNEYRNQLRVK